MDCKFKTDLGTVTVNEEVLLKIASYTALGCYGIVAMASKSAKDGLIQLWNRDNLGRGVRLRSGMTIAVEPMVNAGTWRVKTLSDGWTVKTLDGRLSAHYENTICVSDNGPVTLTAV